MRFSLMISLCMAATFAGVFSLCTALDFFVSMDGEISGDQFGISVSTAGDVNQDGHDDVIVGADANDEGGTSAGKTYVYFGGAPIDAIADIEMIGSAGDFLGVSVSSAGDVNDDDYDDVVVGAHFNSDVALRAGKAFVYFGGNPMDTVPDIVMWGEREKDYFGISVSGGGDVNQDGFDDVIVGAYKSDLIVGSDTTEDVGKVYIYHGGSDADNVPDLVLAGFHEGERFGYSVSSAGDVNHDGYCDVIAGAYSYDQGADINIGRAYVFFGGDPMDSLPDVTMTGEEAYNYFGYSVSGAGDVNADGYDDVIVGAYGYGLGAPSEAGKAYVYWGGPGMDNVPDATMSAGEDSVRFGISVSQAGKMNYDVYGDFLVGADADDEGGTNAGKVHVFFGDSLMGTQADTVLTGEDADDAFGHAVSDAGDVNMDGHGDMIVGAWKVQDYTGRAYIYGMASGTSSPFIRGDADADSTVVMSDAVYCLRYLYVPGSPPPPCADASDSNDNGNVTMSDAIYILRYLYVPGAPEPAAPFPECGLNPTVDVLDCTSHPCQ